MIYARWRAVTSSQISVGLFKRFSTAATKPDLRTLVIMLENSAENEHLKKVLDTQIGRHFENHSFPRSLFPKLLALVGLQDCPLPSIEARLDLLTRAGILSLNPAKQTSTAGLWLGSDGTDRAPATITELLTILKIISETHPRLEASNFLHVDLMLIQILSEAVLAKQQLLEKHTQVSLVNASAADSWEAAVYKQSCLIETLYNRKLSWKYGHFKL